MRVFFKVWRGKRYIEEENERAEYKKKEKERKKHTTRERYHGRMAYPFVAFMRKIENTTSFIFCRTWDGEWTKTSVREVFTSIRYLIPILMQLPNEFNALNNVINTLLYYLCTTVDFFVFYFNSPDSLLSFSGLSCARRCFDLFSAILTSLSPSLERFLLLSSLLL